MVQLDRGRARSADQRAAFAHRKALVRHEDKLLCAVLRKTSQVVLQLGLDRGDRLLPPRKINGHQDPFPILTTQSVLTPVWSPQRMAGIKAIVPLPQQDLGAQPLRRSLSVRPLKQAVPRLIPPEAHVPRSFRTCHSPAPS